MRLEWAVHAIEDRMNIFDYIEADNPQAAAIVDERISQHVQQLISHPRSGRIGRVENTRELIIDRTPFIAAYRIVGNTVRILRVLHGAQQWPDGLPRLSKLYFTGRRPWTFHNLVTYRNRRRYSQ